MKSKENVKYQRDTMMELAKMSIKSMINDVEADKVTKEDIVNKMYNIQSIINTTKVLDWIYNMDDESNIDDYYDSSFEIEVEKELDIEELNKLLILKKLI